MFFPGSAVHEQDWQPCPIDTYFCYMCDHTHMLPQSHRDTVSPFILDDKLDVFHHSHGGSLEVALQQEYLLRWISREKIIDLCSQLSSLHDIKFHLVGKGKAEHSSTKWGEPTSVTRHSCIRPG